MKAQEMKNGGPLRGDLMSVRMYGMQQARVKEVRKEEPRSPEAPQTHGGGRSDRGSSQSTPSRDGTAIVNSACACASKCSGFYLQLTLT